MVVRLQNGETATLDFRRKHLPQPRNMLPGQHRTGGLEMPSWPLSWPLVPVLPAGMWEAHQRYGSLPGPCCCNLLLTWRRKDFPLLKHRRVCSIDAGEDFAKEIHATLICAATATGMGDTLKQTDLAATLKRIQLEGRDGFYKGETARLIVEEMQAGNGIITCDDLATYDAVWRHPLQFRYHEYTIISMPPPSSGGVALGTTAGDCWNLSISLLWDIIHQTTSTW